MIGQRTFEIYQPRCRVHDHDSPRPGTHEIWISVAETLANVDVSAEPNSRTRICAHQSRCFASLERAGDAPRWPSTPPLYAGFASITEVL